MRTLFVCSGNIMRSVIAESVFLARAAELLGDRASTLEAESGGLEPVENSGPHPDCIKALELLGIPLCGSTASSLSGEVIDRSDLVLTMTRQQSYQMAHRFPEYKKRFFSLIEVNGAIETLLEERGVAFEERSPEDIDRLTEVELVGMLDGAVSALRETPREALRPIPDVPLDVREFMTRFSPCFYQVSAIHDPIGGTAEETERCAHQIDTEVTRFVRGTLALALSDINRTDR
jgi:protein-tyrosine-phosphatase